MHPCPKRREFQTLLVEAVVEEAVAAEMVDVEDVVHEAEAVLHPSREGALQILDHQPGGRAVSMRLSTAIVQSITALRWHSLIPLQRASLCQLQVFGVLDEPC